MNQQEAPHPAPSCVLGALLPYRRAGVDQPYTQPHLQEYEDICEKNYPHTDLAVLTVYFMSPPKEP